jgi:xylose isomerase
MIRRINMAHPKNEWAETKIGRGDIKSLLNNTKKLAEMYSELLKVRREGWENILETQLKREKQEKKEQSGE